MDSPLILPADEVT